MPSTQIDIKGTLEWAKVFESNRDQAEWNTDTNGEYKVTVTTDKKTQRCLKKAGCQKKMEEVDGGVDSLCHVLTLALKTGWVVSLSLLIFQVRLGI